MHVLDSPPERPARPDTACPRTDHEALAAAGDTVLLYTDGLVEIGRTGIDEGITRLAMDSPGCGPHRWTTSAMGSLPGSRPAAPTTTSRYSPCTQAPTADGAPAAR